MLVNESSSPDKEKIITQLSANLGLRVAPRLGLPRVLTAASSVSDGDVAADPAGFGPQVALVVVGDAVGATDRIQVGGTLGALTHRPPLPLHAHAPVAALVPSTGALLSCRRKIQDGAGVSFTG